MTSKEALQRIGEYSEAAITIRGTYFPPGKEPKEGERKIYLAIESMSVKLIFRFWPLKPGKCTPSLPVYTILMFLI